MNNIWAKIFGKKTKPVVHNECLIHGHLKAINKSLDNSTKAVENISRSVSIISNYKIDRLNQIIARISEINEYLKTPEFSAQSSVHPSLLEKYLNEVKSLVAESDAL